MIECETYNTDLPGDICLADEVCLVLAWLLVAGIYHSYNVSLGKKIIGREK